ncbi:MAG: DNA polymerase/3'-5' exonuclease PolX [Xanthomonadaceae bacterium]|nr:DNA polymerase/3'-5' exonuclease PolX [Xanthomonadaceae bacterium]
MAVHNADIAAVFQEIADLLALQDANPFRIRAYANAARTIDGWPEELDLWTRRGHKLDDIPGIGEDLAGKIREILDTGSCAALQRLRRGFPAGITDLLRVPGLGPKRVRTLYRELHVETPEQLLRAARDGRIRALPGFGATSEKRILEAASAYVGREQRMPLAKAATYAEALLEWLRGARGAQDAVVAGSYRRMRETVGDIDVLVSAPRGGPVADRFVAYDEVERVLAKGGTRASVVLKSGLQVDLRVVAPESYGAALVYFTGSKAHNIELRRMAQQRGLKINEYGVFRDGQRIAGDTEASVYATLDLDWVPPELREDRGEIEAARRHALPKLVELADLRGDLHAHTNATDGRGTLEEMAAAARAAGLEYLAITEHSRRVTMAHGLDAARLGEQIDAIDRLNGTLHGLTLLKGIEVDILEDGTLDLPDKVLARLDLVVGAVHSAFHLSRKQQTERILRAMDRPCFSILAHPTGRLLSEREPYDVDMERIVRHARQRGCFLELNAHPERLDLLDTHCRMAKDEGVLVAVSSDAHAPADFGVLHYGIGQARRGWLEKGDVLNTRPLGALRRLLAGTMRG